MSNSDKAMEWMLRCKDSLEKEIPLLLEKAIKERDGWFFTSMSALLSATEEQKKDFVEKVLGHHMGFSDGSVWRTDLLFP